MGEVVALKLPTARSSILLVEDSVSDALLIKKAISKAATGECSVRHEKTLEAALKALAEEEYEVALLDLSLPDSADFDGLLSIQNMAPKLPVVILTAYADEEMGMKAVERGAQDYLFKDKADGKSIHRAMQYAVQRKQFEATLITQANFDTLTGLANRTLFESRLDMALARMQRSRTGIGVLFLDLNRFKYVNDTLGHAVGDKLLKQVAERLKQCVRPYDTAARFGGDEFALLVEGITQSRGYAAIAQKILTQIKMPFVIDSKQVEVGVSIGIAICLAGEEESRDTLMLHADEAMYAAKQVHTNNYRFYIPAFHEEACARAKLEEELRHAYLHNQLALHYQPKIDLRTGHTTGAEALIRWEHTERGLLLPSEFLAVAEGTELGKDIEAWVFNTVCADIARWQQEGLPPLRVSVNISPTQLDSIQFPEWLSGLLSHYGISPDLLVIEIPSSALLERTEERLKILSAIHELGIAMHLDHFGASAVSLMLLKTLSIDAVKIAPELTRTINDVGGMLPLVQGLIDIAHRFEVSVIAAGIENEWQQIFFKERQCREGQGFGLCRPVPVAYVPDWLRQNCAPAVPG